MKLPTTPITIIESYFGRELNRSELKGFDEVRDDDWIDFSKQYLAQMKHNFAADFLQPSATSPDSLRLYFEPRISRMPGMRPL